MSAVAEDAEKKTTLAQDLRALLGSPRELWLVLATKLLEYVGVFSLLYVLTFWLSKDLAMDDVRAGWWAGTFSLITSIAAFFIGFAADSVGFRAAMIVAFASSTISRGMISFGGFAGPRAALVIHLAGLMLLALGVGGGTSAMNAALRRYTTPRTRSIGFALYYTSFNIGGMIAGFLVDACRSRFAAPDPNDATKTVQIFKTVHLPILGDIVMSAYGMVFLVGFFCSLAAFVISCLQRRGIDAEVLAGLEPPPPAVEAPRKAPWSIAREVMSQRPFWRFMLFVGLLCFVKLIFQHYHFTWPKYVVRELGESFPIGKFLAINPFAIILLVPIATALTRRRSAFKCIVAGGFISCVSMFVLMLPASWGVQILAIAFLTLGEAVWSPRIYEYTAEIAPKGREASYMGLSTLPFFFAKMVAGPMSGYLLSRYCPADGPRHSSTMWLIIGLCAIAGPILMVLFRGVIAGGKKAAVVPLPAAKVQPVEDASPAA